MASKEVEVGTGVAIYCRVSTIEQKNEGISLETQEARCRQHIEGMPHLVSPSITIYKDDGFSGGLGYFKEGIRKNKFRPHLTRMLQDIKDGKIRYLVIYRNDRLSRNLKLWVEILDDFIIPHNVEMISICEPLSPLTSQGKLTANIMASVAEFQRGWTAENIRDVLQYKREQGYFTGYPCYGWEWSDERRDGHKLVRRNEREGETVQLICRIILSGWNLSRISRELESRDIPSPSGSRKWWPDVVKRIALEPFNAGLVKQEDGSMVRGQHYGIRYFDPEYHQEVTEQVKKIGRIAPVTRTSQTHLLLPKLTCAHCGHRLYVDKREDFRHRVYWCKNHSVTRGRNCPGARAKIVWADAVVVEVIRKLSQDEYLTREAETVIERELAEDLGKLRQEKAKLERDLREDGERLADTVERLADGAIEDFAYKAFEERIKTRRQERTARLGEIETTLQNADASRKRIREVKETLRDFEQVWESLRVDEQRKLVDLLIEELTLSETHLRIKPFFTDAVEVKIPYGRFRMGKPGDPGGLSARELAVLKGLGDGLKPQEIARKSGLSLQTVYGTVSRIRSWLGIEEIEKAIELARPVIQERGNDLPVDVRLGQRRLQMPDEPTDKQLEVLRAVAKHDTRAEAFRELGIPYINGSQRLRLLMKKVAAENLDDLFQVALERGWIEEIPRRNENTGLVFTRAEAEMITACAGARSIAAAGRSLGLSAVAANSRVHTVYEKLGVSGLRNVFSKLAELGLDPYRLPVSKQSGLHVASSDATQTDPPDPAGDQ